MSEGLHQSISRHRAALSEMLEGQFDTLAERCEKAWTDQDWLNHELMRFFETCPFCKFVYAVDAEGTQVSANASREGLIYEHIGRDRSERPYMQQIAPEQDFLLSDTYISETERRPSVTALKQVKLNGNLLGYIGADFDLRELPQNSELYKEPSHWQQIKGDPAIRGTLFQQHRVDSLLDQNIDTVLAIVADLFIECGVFHCKIHFSSSRATIWMTSDPYRYRILALDDLIDPAICFAYPPEPYPRRGVISSKLIWPVLENFRNLRFADETLYLRAGSLNIFNGMVGLTFSCDGSHYMHAKEFLHKNMNFWTGEGGNPCGDS